MSYSFANLKTPQNTASGVADYVLLAPVAWFNTIQCPEPPYTNRGDEVTIWNDHVLNFGKSFIRLNLAPEKNQLQGANIGDRGFQKLDLQFEGFLAGSYAQSHETIKNLINVPLIVLVPDSNCILQQFYQLGCDCAYAWASPAFSTGTLREGNKGYQLNINYLGGYVQLYKGLIDVQADEESSSSTYEPPTDPYLLINETDGLLINDGGDLLLL